MKPGAPDSNGQWYDLIKNRFRVVRWNDSVHASVVFTPDRTYNNPPVGALIVDDGGSHVGKFARA